jgi:hypothetical protein
MNEWISSYLAYYSESVGALVSATVHSTSGNPFVCKSRGVSTNVVTIIYGRDPATYCGMSGTFGYSWKAGTAWYHPRSILLWYVRSLVHKNVCICKMICVMLPLNVIEVLILWSWQRRLLSLCMHNICIQYMGMYKYASTLKGAARTVS